MKLSRRALPALAQWRPLKIAAVEIWELRGHPETRRGVNQQYQANPLHIYDELRPGPYRDSPAPTVANAAVRTLYLKIRTDAGVDGLYGPVDKEAAIVIDEQLRPFLTGKDAMAQEKLWDQLYRSNRHARRGHFLMAISAVDNALWDLRGRYFKVPVYRLLGGRADAIHGRSLCQLPRLLARARARPVPGRAAQAGGLSLSEVVSRLRPRRRPRRSPQERRPRPPSPRSRRRSAVPAWRALRIDPMDALHYQ